MAFLNVPLSHVIYCKNIPGFPLPSTSPKHNSMLVKQMIYGLHQSSREFYIFLQGVLEDIGLTWNDHDHAVFYSSFITPPDPFVQLSANGSPLQIIMPVHIDNGLVVTNSLLLYHWILSCMNKKLEIIDQGPASLYLSIRIQWDLAC